MRELVGMSRHTSLYCHFILADIRGTLPRLDEMGRRGWSGTMSVGVGLDMFHMAERR